MPKIRPQVRNDVLARTGRRHSRPEVLQQVWSIAVKRDVHKLERYW